MESSSVSTGVQDLISDLFVNFCKLIQVVLQKGDLLFLCGTASAVVQLQLRALKHSLMAHMIILILFNTLQ